MPGASEQTRKVTVPNANWAAGLDREDGRFELMLVTEDGEQHTIAPSPASVTAPLALARVDAVLLWNSVNRTLIAANIIGTWLEEIPAGGYAELFTLQAAAYTDQPPPDGNRDAGIMAAVVPRQEPAR